MTHKIDTTTTIDQLTKKASKPEEIAHLQALAGTIEPGTYLDSLFSGPFMTWVAEQIKNDFPPDLFEYYKQEQVEATSARNGKAQAEREAEALRDKLKMATAAYDQAGATAASTIQNLQAIKHDYEGQIAQLQTRLETAREAAAANAEDLNAQIVNLKAKLYDLMVK